MKVGIVVPYSWSFGGGVVDHAEAQARALEAIGIETRLLIGNDPPGSFSRVLHPRQGRPGPPPPGVIPLGRSVIVPGNGALSNLVLSPRALPRLRRVLARERFDLLHVHEPLAPMLSPAALALWDGPAVATFHAAGNSSWRPFAEPLWGFLLEPDRPARRRLGAGALRGRPVRARALRGDPERRRDPAEGSTRATAPTSIVFAGRHDPRKGLPVLLRAWPRLRGSGIRLRVIGADPLAVRLLLARLAHVGGGDRRPRLRRRRDAHGGARGGEAPRRAVARQRELRHDDHARFRVRDAGRRLGHPRLSRGRHARRPAPSSRPATPDALAETIAALLADEPARAERGRAARERAESEYAWPLLARRLADCYERVL